MRALILDGSPRLVHDHPEPSPEAGELLTSLEQWLHMRPGSVEVDVEAVLRPYASVAAVDDEPQRNAS